MLNSFHVCNPYCGKCRPPKERPLICPQCNRLNDPTQGEIDTCVVCGADLPERTLPVPEYCNLIKEICNNPCGKKNRSSGTEKVVCIYHT